MLSAVILTWNSEKYIEKCLLSLISDLNGSRIPCEIFVVDNGSQDKTLEILENFKLKHDNLYIIKLEKNYGTTIPRNIAIRQSKGKYILILDSDTEIRKGTIKELVETLESNDKIGLVAPRLFYPDGQVQYSCKKFPTILLKILKAIPIHILKAIGEKLELYDQKIYSKDFKDLVEVDHCISACWLLRKKALEDVGLLDEKIFYAPEDVDLCLRLWLKGYKVVYNPKAEVIHYTQRVSHKNLKFLITHAKGLLYYFLKHKYFFSTKKLYDKIKEVSK